MFFSLHILHDCLPSVHPCMKGTSNKKKILWYWNQTFYVRNLLVNDCFRSTIKFFKIVFICSNLLLIEEILHEFMDSLSHYLPVLYVLSVDSPVSETRSFWRQKDKPGQRHKGGFKFLLQKQIPKLVHISSIQKYSAAFLRAFDEQMRKYSVSLRRTIIHRPGWRSF